MTLSGGRMTIWVRVKCIGIFLLKRIEYERDPSENVSASSV